MTERTKRTRHDEEMGKRTNKSSNNNNNNDDDDKNKNDIDIDVEHADYGGRPG